MTVIVFGHVTLSLHFFAICLIAQLYDYFVLVIACYLGSYLDRTDH